MELRGIQWRFCVALRRNSMGIFVSENPAFAPYETPQESPLNSKDSPAFPQAHTYSPNSIPLELLEKQGERISHPLSLSLSLSLFLKALPALGFSMGVSSHRARFRCACAISVARQSLVIVSLLQRRGKNVACALTQILFIDNNFNTFISATDPSFFLGVDACRVPGEGQF